MGSCYSADYIGGDHIHTDVATCNIEELQKKFEWLLCVFVGDA